MVNWLKSKIILVLCSRYDKPVLRANWRLLHLKSFSYFSILLEFKLIKCSPEFCSPLWTFLSVIFQSSYLPSPPSKQVNVHFGGLLFCLLIPLSNQKLFSSALLADVNINVDWYISKQLAQIFFLIKLQHLQTLVDVTLCSTTVLFLSFILHQHLSI